MKTWVAWTDGQLATLEALRFQGLTCREIAVAMNRTEASIRNAVTQNKFDHVPAGRERWAIVLACPRPIRQTAAIMGTTIWAVKQAARKLRRAGFDIPFVRKRRQVPA
jgi:hypothetical protein